MKLYLFLTLNHFAVPKTFIVMTLLSPLADAWDVRLPGPPLLAPPPLVRGLVSAVLRVKARAGLGSGIGQE